MNAYMHAVRRQNATQRILTAAKKIAALAPDYEADALVVALEEVKDKDPQVEGVKQLEAIADLLDQLVVKMPSTAPARPPKVDEAMSAEMPNAGTLRKGKR